MSPLKKHSIFFESYSQQNLGSIKAISATELKKSRHSCITPKIGISDQVTIKQRETKSMIAEDPDFVKKLLAKYLVEQGGDKNDGEAVTVSGIH